MPDGGKRELCLGGHREKGKRAQRVEVICQGVRGDTERGESIA